FAREVVEAHGGAHLLINNAGVGLFGTVEQLSIEDIEWLMGVNFWGVVYGVKHFLPILRRQSEGHIVNVSSVFGIVAPVNHSAYVASKFAVRGFTEALRHELAGGPVKVSVVHPAASKPTSPKTPGPAPERTGRRSIGRGRFSIWRRGPRPRRPQT